MTITNRVSAFFLSTLAVVLIGFSILLYCLARASLYSQAEGRLSAVVDTLVAALEDEPDGLEWDRSKRVLEFGAEGDTVSWAIADEDGSPVDSSGDRQASRLAGGADSRYLRRQRSVHSSNIREKPLRSVTGAPRYSEVAIVAGMSTRPIQESLNRLAWTLFGVSFGVWSVAAWVNRWLCRKALAPLARMSVVVRDISVDNLGHRLPGLQARDELSELTDSFNDLLDRLQESYERQKRFTGEASHQLRTPLTVLKGSIDVALRRDRPPEEYRRVLGVLSRKVDDLQSLSEMLLFLASSDAEARLLRLSRLDLSAWLAGFAKEVQEAHPGRTIRLKRASERPMFASVHAGLLSQLLGNLIDNALKHSPPTEPVSIELEETPEGVYLSVRDNGSGISADDLPHIFEPFYRSDASRNAGLGGVGLGLAIARKIADALAAEISVESLLGQGSRFRIGFRKTAGDEA